MSKDDAASKPLTEKQETFCREYLIDLNATQAAVRAGYSDRSAEQQGSRLLSNAKVAARIQELMQSRAERTQITADRVLEELAAIGFTSFRDLASWNEEHLAFTPSHELTEAAARSVKSVKVKRTTVRGKDDYEQTTVEMEISQHDKISALDKLAKHLGIYAEVGGDERKNDKPPVIINMPSRALTPEEIEEAKRANRA